MSYYVTFETWKARNQISIWQLNKISKECMYIASSVDYIKWNFKSQLLFNLAIDNGWQQDSYFDVWPYGHGGTT